MAKHVSGKAILITNLFVFIFGVLLVLVVVAVNSPPSSRIASSGKYITITSEDMFFPSATELERFSVQVSVYDGSSSNPDRLRQTFNITQQERLLNVLVRSNDVIVFDYLSTLNTQTENNIINKIEYLLGEQYSSTTKLFITRFAIYTNNEYIPRSNLKAVSLTSNSDGITNTSPINLNIIQGNGGSETVILSSPKNYYKSTPVPVTGPKFSSIDFGLPLNEQVMIDAVGSTPLTVTSLNTSATVVGTDNNSNPFLLLCCGEIACGASGPGNATTLSFTNNDDVCAAVANIE